MMRGAQVGVSSQPVQANRQLQCRKGTYT
jgi:hypothetical protein